MTPDGKCVGDDSHGDGHRPNDARLIPASNRGRLRSALNELTWLISGADVFISYRRKVANEYVQALHTQITGRGLTCFLDSENLAAGMSIEECENQARRARVFVLVGTKEVFDSVFIQRELSEYESGHRRWWRRLGKRIVPINFGGCLDRFHATKPDVAADANWIALRGLITEPESLHALEAGIPSRTVVDRVLQSVGLVRATVRTLVISLFIGVGIALAAAGMVFPAVLEARRLAAKEAASVQFNRFVGDSLGAMNEDPELASLLMVAATRYAESTGVETGGLEDDLLRVLPKLAGLAVPRHPEAVFSVAVNDRGQVAVAGPTMVVVHDLNDRARFQIAPPPREPTSNTQSIRSIELAPQGNWLVGFTTENDAYAWKLDEANQRVGSPLHFPAQKVKFSPERDRVALVDPSKRLFVLDMDSFPPNELQPTEAIATGVDAVEWSQTGKVLIAKVRVRSATDPSDSRDRIVAVFPESADPRAVRELPTQHPSLGRMAVSPEGRWIAVVESPEDPRSSSELAIFDTRAQNLARIVVNKKISADRLKFGELETLAACDEKRIQTWEFTQAGWSALPEIETTRAIWEIVWLRGTKWLITSNYDDEITAWPTATSREDDPVVISQAALGIFNLVSSPKGEFVAGWSSRVGVTTRGVVRLWRTKMLFESPIVKRVFLPDGFHSHELDPVISPNGDWIFAAGEELSVLINARKGEVQRDVWKSRARATFDSTGAWLLVAENGVVSLVRIGDGSSSKPSIIEVGDDAATRTKFSPSGRWLFVSTANRTSIWELGSTPLMRASWSYSMGAAAEIEISPDDKWAIGIDEHASKVLIDIESSCASGRLNCRALDVAVNGGTGFSVDGAWLATQGQADQLILTSLRGKTWKEFKIPLGVASRWELSFGGDWLLAVPSDSNPAVPPVMVNFERQPTTFRLTDHVGAMVTLSTDGKWLALGSAGSCPTIGRTSDVVVGIGPVANPRTDDSGWSWYQSPRGCALIAKHGTEAESEWHVAGRTSIRIDDLPAPDSWTFSPDGSWLASTLAEGGSMLWRVDSEFELHPTRLWEDIGVRVGAASFSADSRRMITWNIPSSFIDVWRLDLIPTLDDIRPYLSRDLSAAEWLASRVPAAERPTTFPDFPQVIQPRAQSRK